MSSSKTLLKNIVGVDGYEALEKAIYRSATQSVADPLELYLPLLVVPRAILSWLVQNIRPLKVGEHKEFKYPGKDDITINVEKQSTDVYRGEMVQRGRIIHNFDKQSLPSIGGHLMTVFEDYDGLAAKDKEPEAPKADAPKEEKISPEPKAGDSKEVVRSMMDLGGITAENADPEAVKWLTAHANVKQLTAVVGKLVDALVARQIGREELLSTAEDKVAKEELPGAKQQVKESISPEEKAKADQKAKESHPDVIENKESAKSPTLQDVIRINEDRGAPKCERVKGEADKMQKEEKPAAPAPKPSFRRAYSGGRSWASKRGAVRPATMEQLNAALDAVEAKNKARQAEQSPKSIAQEPAKKVEPLSKPYVSDAQRRWAHTATGTKALGGESKVKEWDKESKGKALPERSEKAEMPTKRTPRVNLELEQSIHNLKMRPPMGLKRIDDEHDDKLKRLQSLLSEQAAKKTKKAEMPAGAGMAQSPAKQTKPKMPVMPSNNPAAAQKQTMASSKGLQSGPKLPGAPKMKTPGSTVQGPKGPAGPKMTKGEYFASLKKKRVLEPLIKPNVQKSEKAYFVAKEEIYHECDFCGMPEFSKNTKGEPELSPCACFSVMAKSESGRPIKFAKVSKTEDGNFKLSFHKSVDAESTRAFLLTLKAKLLLSKQTK